MPGRRPRPVASLLASLCCLAGLARAESPADSAPPVSFERDVRPILKAACFHCHGEEQELSGGLDTRLKRFLVSGGDSGAAIVPGKPEESYLLDRVRLGEMPPEGAGEPLPAEKVDVIERWIAAGAPTLRPEPESLDRGLVITEEDRNWWAFQPVRRPDLPDVQAADRVRTPIDRFALQKLEEQGLSFAEDADRRTLIRRLSLDLTGLPPTPDEVDRFLADPAPDAYEQLVERLLASPHYGERWGRHWLDVAGYADSEGVTLDDPERKWAWKYRDYVIRAFNADKPFDEFVREQLAGDELVERPYDNLSPDEADKLAATGFLRMAPDATATGGSDDPVARNEVMVKTIEIVGGALLGTTVKCAQCHEHRYDPIPQADYYRMRAVFEPALDWKQWRRPQQRLISLYTDADRARAAELEAEAKQVEEARAKKQAEFIEATFQKELAKLPEEEREAAAAARNTPEKERTDGQKALLKKYPSLNVSAGSLYLYDRKAADELKQMAADAKAIRDRKPKEEFLRALTEVPGQVPDTFLFHRGDHEQPKEKLEPAGLTVIGGDSAANAIPVDDPVLPTTGRRLAYANYLTSGEHPLLARVIVNRIWLNHFGRGLVDTPGDFGRLGSKPSHPKLLDWLADEFVRSGWSVERLHRLIVASTAYRQSSRRSDEQIAADPDDVLLGGFPLGRLDAETLRDSVLAISGKLNREPFGPPVPVMADKVGQWVIGIENLNAGRPGPVIPMHGREFRRSVYVQVRRSRPLAVLDTFDWPRMDPNCEVRASSTVAPQSLMMMNGPFVMEQAEHLAARIASEVGDDSLERVRRAWRLVFSREPAMEELEDAAMFLREQSEALKPRAEKRDPAVLALASLCQVLLGSNEFLYVD